MKKHLRTQPWWHGLAWILAVIVLTWAAGCPGSSGGGGGGADGDGGGDDGVIPDPPLPIAGDYEVTVDTLVDTCGLGGGAVVTPMLVEETSAVTADVDLPSPNGECNRLEFVRTDNTLERFETSQQDIGPCPVQVDLTTNLDFFDDDTVSGSEIAEFTVLDVAACDGVFSDCVVQLAVAGARCDACFSCLPSPAGAAGGWGALGHAAGLRERIRTLGVD